MKTNASLRRGRTVGFQLLGPVFLLASCSEEASPQGSTSGGGAANATPSGSTETAAISGGDQATTSGGETTTQAATVSGGSPSGSTSTSAGTGGSSSVTTSTSATSDSATGGGSTASGSTEGNSIGDSSTSGSSTTGGSSEGATIVPDPSWACGRPDGIVDPELGELVFSGSLDIGEVREVGTTQHGSRRLVNITGGSVAGNLDATFLDGGLDFELTLSTGTIELEQVAMLRASDNTLIYLRTCGVAAGGDSAVRIVPDFEVANGSALAWLNTGEFVGTRSIEGSTMTLAVYDVSGVSPSAPMLALTDPDDVEDQPWDCHVLSGSRGAEVFSEVVAIGSSLSVGASKNGTRNVIPITGGTVTGRFTGTVMNAGADYQLLGGQATLDARYVLESDDGEFVIVRNCGPGGGLVPWFEARADGPYAFLNDNTYVSSDPGVAGGGVNITFYETQ